MQTHNTNAFDDSYSRQTTM